MNICFHSLGYVPRKGITGSCSNLMSNFLRNCKAVAPFYIPAGMYGGSDFSTSSSTLVIACLFDYGHPSGCEGVTYCGFDCLSLMADDVEHLFMRSLIIYISTLQNIMSSFFYISLFYFILFYFWLRWVFVAARGFFSCFGEQGLLFVAVRGLLIVVASLVGSMGSRCTGFSSCSTQAQ